MIERADHLPAGTLHDPGVQWCGSATRLAFSTECGNLAHTFPPVFTVYDLSILV